MRFILSMLFALAVATMGCGGSKSSVEPAQHQVVETQAAEPKASPRYVLVHRNTPIRLAPDDDAPFLQYRTPERQQKVEARRLEEAEERREDRREELAEREEREAERAERLRKRRRRLSRERRAELAEQDAERAAKMRYQRAERTLRDARRRASRDVIEAPHREFIPFQLVGETGGWAQLRPVSRAAEATHCYRGNFGEVDRLDATFWVRPAQLAPLTSKRVRVPTSDGAEVILLPGVAVSPTDGDKYRVVVDGFDVELPVPDNVVGTSYEPGRPFEAPMTDSVFNPIGYVEGHFRLGKRQLFPFNPYRKLYVTGTLVIGSRFYITTQTPCSEWTIRGPKELLEPVGRRGATRLSGGSTTVDPPYAAKGSQSYLPSGDPFAVANVPFPLGRHTEDRGSRKCYRSAVWGDNDAAVSRSMELCFESKDLVLSEE